MSARKEVWPTSRFYWSLLDAPAWHRAGVLPAGLNELVEHDLPIPSAELQLVCAPAPGGRLLVCGARTADLADLPGDVISLHPEEVPADVGVTVPSNELNLLVGSLEPLVLRRARRRAHGLAIAALVACTILACIGLHRRAVALERESRETTGVSTELLAQAPPGQSAEQLALDVQRRRVSAGAASTLKTPHDASPTLAAVLRSWPNGVPAKPLTLSVTPDSASIALTVEDDPSPFIHAFTPPAGWALDEPRLNKAGRTTRVTLQLRRPQEAIP